ncbi:NAD(+) diphosphatase [Rodentibacter caecimuris]|uniref:NAD-capped RNA hydrolase NudC n=1 Tax=Rodentibacter caecimuris TaxID=1796644 RepID=A0ABX3KZP9_9PAST|nr:NADH pyrophosphatase [Rodentibacter heylii]
MQKIQTEDYGYWLFTRGSTIHLIEDQLPFGKAWQVGSVDLSGRIIGEWNNQPLWLVQETIDTRAYYSLRDQLFRPTEQFYLLSRGVEINHFLSSHRFCGKCGTPTSIVKEELALQCQSESCSYRCYPVICPSIIVAVRKGTDILLANHLRHKGGIYTTLAGFVEVGETFEQAVTREVLEETGINVKNIRYFSNQPWAFPNSQMVGFLADYESGEICLQETEIYDAKWFSYRQTLPELPPKGTIALELINATLALCAEQDK